MRTVIKRSAAVCGASMLVAAGWVNPAAAATPVSYVALGDSYSSGVGTGSYLNDGTNCQRSTYAYPSLLAAATGWQLTFRACSGATVADVSSGQLSSLSAGTGRVSISVGGNDAGFADVLTECALPGWMSNCNRAIDGAQGYIRDTLPGRLSGLYSDIRARAGAAEVVVVGYPRLFNGEDCNAGTWFSPAEESRLNATADLLNATLRTAAGNAGYRFADPTNAFVGHAVCDNPEWLNGLSWPITESYHPNRAGQASGYLPLVSAAANTTAVASPEVLARAAASADTLTARVRPDAATDRTVQPKKFAKPDLDSPAAKAAAARAGIDLDQLKAADKAAAAAWAKTKNAAKAAGDHAASKAAEWGSAAAGKASEWGSAAAGKASEWGSAASGKASEWGSSIGSVFGG
ncbi:GDSL-type esterase/lipase family protein [Nakamurella aerolata]|uniref:SGNH/GDSL hydrolase family protein n=1 Tax=Nakamurella aerolata TaxID=1656892 RepID=A0A849A0W0_9ACTN|nr:SGNH/GDSL hydrolase family protein [Nakamurella aerolata]